MISINVYNENDEIIKTVTAEPVTIRYGQVRDVMVLLDAENIESTYDLMKAVHRAYAQLVKVLAKAFPEITEAEWDNVRMDELVWALMSVIRESFNAIMKVPRDPK